MCSRIKRSAISPLRDAGGGASSEARPESSYRFKPKFILVVASAEEFIATNAYRFGINLPDSEVLVGDMNEVYQTALDDRLVVFTEIHFWDSERSLGHWHESYHMSFGASQF